MLKIGSDFSGVGAFNQALLRLGKPYKEVFACDIDKYARQTFIENYGEPEYYPTNVYQREIPKDSLDIYMTSPPCQAFSLAGKRLGKEDKRGILFFNSYEFIQVNKPRFFIFENVKGLLSDDNGNTFSEWVNMLGGKSVNGVPVLFPYEESVPYHLYWKVLNAKEHGVPQNRERVFLIGIRDDSDNNFKFPKEEHLTKRLKDVLEENVEDKYFLSEERINTITNSERGIGWTDADKKDAANCVLTMYSKNPTDGEYIKVKSATAKGYEEATEGVIIGISVHPFSKKLEFKGVETQTCPTLLATDYKAPKTWHFDNYKIRRLTPRECFRLMDFPDTFTWPVSDSQAYKQAGNSIVVNVLYKIIKNLPL
jgi:DNA (cytosine-5)-methyltransferase 1